MIWLSILYFTASEGRKRDHALSHVSVNVSMQATNHDCPLYAWVTFVKNAPYLQSLYKKAIGSVLEMWCVKCLFSGDTEYVKHVIMTNNAITPGTLAKDQWLF